ncbi:hypothetical protein [Streptomyces sp. NPDC055709]
MDAVLAECGAVQERLRKPPPAKGAGQALPRAMGSRVRLLRDQGNHARTPCPSSPHPAW